MGKKKVSSVENNDINNVTSAEAARISIFLWEFKADTAVRAATWGIRGMETRAICN